MEYADQQDLSTSLNEPLLSNVNQNSGVDPVTDPTTQIDFSINDNQTPIIYLDEQPTTDAVVSV